MLYFIFIPYILSKNIFIDKELYSCEVILIIIDIIYILDIIINFFRAYQNFDENLILKSKKIIANYLKTWFFFDFIQGIPFFSLIQFHRKSIKLNNRNHYFKALDPMYNIILIIKILKVYKLLNYNSTISYLSEILSESEIIDNYGSVISSIILSLLCLNVATCLYIFFGNNLYNSWLIKLNMQDESYLYIFITSVYFVIVTITTVGYGDITGNTLPEILFQIFLLIIGTIAYSFIISYFSNVIVKNNKKSMSFEKNLQILQEIKLHHPKMDKFLYNEVLRNLNNEQLYEKKDKNLLFDCMPYSLKNKLIVEMHKPLIKNFIFF